MKAAVTTVANPAPILSSSQRARIDPGIFVGNWTTTNQQTQGIARLIVREVDGRLLVRAFGAMPTSLCDWGEVAAAVFADSPDSSAPRAFTARFDLGYKDVSLQAKVKKGVLVVANFNRFSDDSGRAAFFSREFFYCAPAPERRR
jgi:hypothetical protein